MFTKTSRYRKTPDIVTVDAAGRLLASKELRLLPDVTGTFRYTVTANDRLDHLAYKFYQQPDKWWRICDANPEFLSPDDLLGQGLPGQGSLVTARFPLTVTASPSVGPHAGDPSQPPPWAALFAGLRAVLGVEDVRVEENVLLEPSRPMPGPVAPPERRPDLVEVIFRSVLVTYNALNVGVTSLVSAIVAAGFDPVEPVLAGQLGQQIVIPPDATG